MMPKIARGDVLLAIIQAERELIGIYEPVALIDGLTDRQREVVDEALFALQRARHFLTAPRSAMAVRAG